MFILKFLYDSYTKYITVIEKYTYFKGIPVYVCNSCIHTANLLLRVDIK